MEIRQGIPASPGFAVGNAFLLDSEEYLIRRRPLGPEEVEPEIARFEEATRASVAEVDGIRQRFADRVGDTYAGIFDAHRWMLEDPQVQDQIRKRIRQHRVCAEYATSRVYRIYARMFREMSDGYFRQRVGDVHENEKRLLRHLLGERRQSLADLTEPVVIVAHDLAPGQTAQFDRSKILGIATDAGGQTSHTAIVARALEIPAVVGLDSITGDVSGGDRIVIDGNRGRVVVDPDEETLKKFEAAQRNFDTFSRELSDSLKDLPAETKDGHAVRLLANIEFPDEVETALAHGAEGVGLFRTEFLFDDGRAVDEPTHFDVYHDVVKKLDGKPLVIRTLDLGGDKPGADAEREPNPILGCRSLRLSFQNPDLFRTQLRAICRVSAFGDVRLLFPMVGSVAEMKRAREILREVQEDLRRENVHFNENMPVGAMIEVPSAAVTIDLLAKHCDFISIGSNDLVQYTLAVDRINARVADLYQPAHPAVLRLLDRILETGRETNVPVTLCGEMSGDVTFTTLLVGMGVEGMSLAPISIPEVKKVIRSITLEEAREMREKVLAFEETSTTVAFLRERASQILPDAF